MLSPHILEAGFDGLVASAGAYAEVDGEVIMDRRFPEDLALRTLDALDANEAVYVLEAQEALHVAPYAEDRLRAIVSEHFERSPSGSAVGASAVLDALEVTPDRSTIRFAKISVFESPVPLQRIIDQVGSGIAVVDNSISDDGRHSGEIYQRGISKADGIAAVIARLGMTREDTVAFGDGQNDLEMIAFAGTGVAIEGSSPEFVALADRMAAPPRDEGLVVAFNNLGLT
jgi:hydroxymethylpyrimidine pyrophosphatase-like HAD family hydrolase